MGTERTIWDRLRAAGLTPAGAAGLMGNLQAESGLSPTNLQNSYEKKLGLSDADYTAAVDKGLYDGFVTDGAGYGLAQWTYHSRKAALLAYAKARGRSVGDLDAQLGYLLQELGSLFPALLDKLCSTGDVGEASDCVLLQFERPADQSAANCARRAALGRAFYDKFAEGADMEIVMTSAELCARALDIADNYKTSYMLGPWGWPANNKMIARATSNGRYAQQNKAWLPQANAIKDRGFLFDCIGLLKGILWGWTGDLSRTYGGAGYELHGFLDWGADTVIQKCREVSTDCSAIVPGEAVWMTGHIGVYVGDGVVVESTPKWQGGVQRSTLANISAKQVPGTVGSRRWTKHGKLPWVDYAAVDKSDTEPTPDRKPEPKPEEDDEDMYYKTLKDVPEWYRPTIRKLMERGALVGHSDPDPNSLEDNLIKVSETYCQAMLTLDRLGVLG